MDRQRMSMKTSMSGSKGRPSSHMNDMSSQPGAGGPRKSMLSMISKGNKLDALRPAGEMKYEDIPEETVKYRNISYQPLFKDKIQKVLENRVYKIVYVLLTLYVLFADDVKVIACDKTADVGFSIVAILIMFLFFVEIIIYLIAYDDDYTCGLFFWIDVMGMVSMILDIHWVNSDIVQNFADAYRQSFDFRIRGLKRLSRGLRIVSRAIKIIRIIKLLKLFKKNKIKQIVEADTENEEIVYQEGSKVGQKLEELTLKRIIILIFVMILAIIFFNSTFYYNPKTVMDFGIQIFNDFKIQNKMFNFTFNVYVKENINTETPLLYARAYDLEWGNLTKAEDLRTIELIEVWDECSQLLPNDKAKNTTSNKCYAVFDNSIDVRFASIMNIMKTLFVCIVLVGGVVTFYRDTNDLVLEPIEKMTQKIKNLSRNPMAAMQDLNDEDSHEVGLVQKISGNCCKMAKRKQAPLETTILEKTISKISTLLVLGFGEAGAEIISVNMQKAAHGDINPMVAGKKVMAIYGFCDIRNFTDTTEILQEKVMIFVNEIAEIVHEITSDTCGSANKNIGDAFLLVWKFDERLVLNEGNELKIVKNPITQQLVDMALMAFIQILCVTHKSFRLSKYRKHDALNKKFGAYSVKMGFGLHLGYSIEGAIGSMFKIDASYLSPNVNMASKLEERTKEYDKPLILSDVFVDHLSDDAKKYIRLIDKVKSDSKNGTPFSLYTVDIDLNALAIETEETENDDDLNKKMEKIKIKRDQRKKLLSDILAGKRVGIFKDFTETPDWKKCREKFSEEFFEYYNAGVSNFYNKNWDLAIVNFKRAKSYIPDDKPTQNFLDYIEKNKKPSDDWNGTKDEEEGGHH